VQTYRAYLLDEQDKIVWGEWIEAADEQQAVALARARRPDGAPRVEVWLGATKLVADPCGD